MEQDEKKILYSDVMSLYANMEVVVLIVRGLVTKSLPQLSY